MKFVNLFSGIIGLSFGTGLIGYAVGLLPYYDWKLKKMSRRTKIEFFAYLFLGLFIAILSL
jgi:hypothetical protein